MKQPLVSILICTYNAENTIENTIKSCLNQTYNNFEILIHDDQSKDDTIKIIKNIKDVRIKIIKSGKKLGPYRGLNFLLNYAKGEYIAIQDHDDLRYTTKIEKQIKFLEKNKEFVGCGTRTMIRYEGDNKGYKYYLGEKFYFTIHPSLVFRNNGYHYDESRIYMGDAYFQKKILCGGRKMIWNIPETLTIHRIKKGAENYTYKRFKLTNKNLNTLFTIYSVFGGICVICFEVIRKFLYPILHKTKKDFIIDKFERLPFVLMGYKIYDFVPKT